MAHTQTRRGEARRLQKKLSAATAHLREALRLHREIVRVAGPATGRVVRLAGVQLNLAQALLDQAEATPAGARRRQRVEEALSLPGVSRGIAEVKANAEADPYLPAELPKQARRAELLAKQSEPVFLRISLYYQHRS